MKDNSYSRTNKIRLDTFAQEFALAPKLGSGGDGRVYQVTKEYAAKVLHNSHGLRKDNDATLLLQREFDIGRDLFNQQISVPKPRGVYRIKLKAEKIIGEEYSGFYPAFVMQFIDGMSLKNFNGDEQRCLMRLFHDEVKKVRELGYDSEDLENLDNCVVGKDKKIYIVDYSTYTRRDGK